MPVWVHRLTNIDSITRTAMCAHCGSVELVKRSGKRGWRCKAARCRPTVAPVARPLPTATELAYSAGFFDGEGCVTIARKTSRAYQYGTHTYRAGYVSHSIFVTVANTDRRAVDALKQAFGGRVARDRRQRTNSRPCYRWDTSARNACHFLRAIRPYLKLKAEQVDLALTFQNTKTWGRLTPERLAERDAFKSNLSALKRVS